MPIVPAQTVNCLITARSAFHLDIEDPHNSICKVSDVKNCYTGMSVEGEEWAIVAMLRRLIFGRELNRHALAAVDVILNQPAG